MSPPGCPSLAENGALRNGTEEVLCLEQCPPTKRLKAALCNSNKEQRVEEDQTRGTGVRCGLAGAWVVWGSLREKKREKKKEKKREKKREKESSHGLALPVCTLQGTSRPHGELGSLNCSP